MLYEIVSEEDGKKCIVKRLEAGAKGELVEGNMNEIEAHWLLKRINENAIECEECNKNITYDECFENYGLCKKCLADKSEKERKIFVKQRVLSRWTYY